MPGCITSEYKEILVNALKAELEPAIIGGIVSSIPICSEGGGGGGKPEAKPSEPRQAAELWPEATYHQKDGTPVTGSFTGLFKQLYGTPVTQDLVCRWWGDKQECRSPSTVENFRNRGDIVKGNGEMAPSPSFDMSAGQVEKLYKDWKNHLLTDGKKINIYHPENPEIKQATTAIETKAKAKK